MFQDWKPMNGIILWAIFFAVFGVFYSIHETYVYCKQKDPPKTFEDIFEIAKFSFLGYTLIGIPLCILYSI